MNRRTLLAAGASTAALAAAVAAAWRGLGSSARYEAWARDLRSPLVPAQGALEWVRYATLAANSHNTQPWRFALDGPAAQPRAITLVPAPDRRTPAVDPDDHHLHVSLGCAAENLLLAATLSARAGTIESAGPAGVRCAFAARATAAAHALAEAIPWRQSTRAAYDTRPLAPAELAQLERAAALPGVDVVVLTDPARRARLRELVVAGNMAQWQDAAFVAELRQWLRFNPAQAMARGDGLFSATTGHPSLPTWLGPLALRLAVRPASDSARQAALLDASAGAVLLFAQQDNAAGWVQVGRASQRLQLAATRLDVRTSFLNQPVEVASLRAELARLAGLPGRRPDLVLRFGKGPRMPWSPRRSVAQVLA
ncbi:MAG: nitroreductase family protein [Pseudomonadota bacterium]|nr:nitroreductase family protein [Pseudomonadota bacterium]